ncbi:unnamed protein product [Moneuplotes crassus]|uniref:Uncharacterized protein n=1 Tax=Euplotes crassus TaxID=5936 RepID=A0AAD1XXA6_EUPCR|nr:unnamed protein product [Moneuplotes crassus]
MLKLLFLTFLYLSVIKSNPFYLHRDLSKDFNMTYGYPQDGEKTRIQFEAYTDTTMTSSTRSTVICIDTNSTTFTVSDGSTKNAFGMSFYCSQASCTNSSQVSTQFFGSQVTYSSGHYIWTHTTNYDIEPMKRGSISGDGTILKTVYGLDTAYHGWSKIPAVGQVVYLKCFAEFMAGNSQVNINNSLTLTSWGTSDVVVNVTTNDFQCLQNSTTCSAYLTKVITVGLLVLVSSIIY